MHNLLTEIDFSNEFTTQIKEKIKIAARQIAKEQSDKLSQFIKPQSDEELQNHFIMTGWPTKFDGQKAEKFLTSFEKQLEKKKINKQNGLKNFQIEWKQGFAYFIFENVSQSKSAIKKLNHQIFSKKHQIQFFCYTIKEFQEILKYSKNYKPITHIPFISKISYNLDEEHRSQFIFRQTDNIYLQWLDHLEKSTQNAIEKDPFSNRQKINQIVFSQRGTYLAICSLKGTTLYGGDKMTLKHCYPQKNTLNVKFSNDERYMVSYNGNQNAQNKQNFIIWAVEEEVKLCSYRAYFMQQLNSFQFSHNSQKLVIVGKNQFFYFNITKIGKFKQQLGQQLEIMTANHHHSCPFIQKIAWLMDNTSFMCVCYDPNFNPNSSPCTKVFFYNTETKEQRKWKSWADHAKKAEITVSTNGYIALSMKKFIKKNHYSTVIQIGNLIKNPNHQIQVNVVDVREQVGNISWDCKNNRFAYTVLQDSTKNQVWKYTVMFYEIQIANKNLELYQISQIKDTLCDRVTLANNGIYFALYNVSENRVERGRYSLGYFSKQVLKQKQKKVNLELIRQEAQMNQMKTFKLDYSGRFILMSNQKSYQVWNVIGDLLKKDTMDKGVFDIDWRPRFINTLPKEQELNIITREKELKKKYEQLDDKRLNFLKAQRQQAKKKKSVQFMIFLSGKKQWYKQYAEIRIQMLNFDEKSVRTSIYEVEESIIEVD